MKKILILLLTVASLSLFADSTKFVKKEVRTISEKINVVKKEDMGLYLDIYEALHMQNSKNPFDLSSKDVSKLRSKFPVLNWTSKYNNKKIEQLLSKNKKFYILISSFKFVDQKNYTYSLDELLKGLAPKNTSMRKLKRQLTEGN